MTKNVVKSRHPHTVTRSPGGEIGRRKGLKIPRPHGRAGSIPAPGTNSMKIDKDINEIMPGYFKKNSQKFIPYIFHRSYICLTLFRFTHLSFCY